VLKNPSQKRAGGMAQEPPKFKPQYRKKDKEHETSLVFGEQY
jgi:hypothetical protein